MTIEERRQRLEHFTSGWAEQSRRELSEHRALWRDTQQQLALLTRRVADGEAQTAALRQEAAERDRITDERIAALRQEAAERDRITDERIANLVSAIGELVKAISKSPPQ
jgi:hypothetical protein